MAATRPTLICMMGLPRSGKSTISKQLSKDLGAPMVNRDSIRLALHGQRYQPEAEDMVKALSKYMIKSLFIAGHDVIICDETNYSKAARNYLKSKTWSTVFYEIHTPPEECIRRAYATGQPDLEPVIKDMFARYEPLTDEDERFTPSCE